MMPVGNVSVKMICVHVPDPVFVRCIVSSDSSPTTNFADDTVTSIIAQPD